jgi:Cd(II)/Pb(II)-responsive transcriptional regulator
MQYGNEQDIVIRNPRVTPRSSMANYKIGELSKKTGFSTDSIRFYETKQLIQPSFRADNNYRYYAEDALKRLQFIQRCRALDLSLKEIETLIALEQQPEQNCHAVNEIIDLHLAQVEKKLTELHKFQQELQQLRQSCNTQNTVDQCQILKQLEAQ